VLRNIFVFKTEEVIEEWRKLHNEEPHDLYFLTKYYERNGMEEDVDAEWLTRSRRETNARVRQENPKKETSWKN